jgi:hypothetical protein
MHARCVYIRELQAEGEKPEEIVRILSCDPVQVRLLGMTEPESILGPWRAEKAQKEAE